MSRAISINGTTHLIYVDDDTPLLWVLRDSLELTGTKYGCGIGMCGACTVHLLGLPVRSCLLPVASVGRAAVTTIEAVSGPETDAVRGAWSALDVPQCGYCQSGQLMSAIALLTNNKTPSDHDIDAAMSGLLCRCATYVRIRAAIHAAARELANVS